MAKVQVSGESYGKFRLIADEIDTKISNVIRDTAGLSVHAHMVNHPDFKALVAMGTKIIPYLVHRIMQDGSGWIYMWLFRAITGVKPPQKYAGRFVHLNAFWLSWYIESEYSNTDIYYGLVSEEKKIAFYAGMFDYCKAW